MAVLRHIANQERFPKGWETLEVLMNSPPTEVRTRGPGRGKMAVLRHLADQARFPKGWEIFDIWFGTKKGTARRWAVGEARALQSDCVAIAALTHFIREGLAQGDFPIEGSQRSAEHTRAYLSARTAWGRQHSGKPIPDLPPNERRRRVLEEGRGELEVTKKRFL